MIWIKHIAWPWLKRNWKWVLFPVGLLLLLFGGAAAVDAISDYAEPPEDLNEKTKETLRKLRTAELEHDRKIVELEQQHKDRLRQLTTEQQSELEALQDKSLTEVAAWFDSL
jgi:hypothetical protein